MSQLDKRLAAIRGLQPLPENERRALDVRNLKQGGYVEFSGQTWQVTRVYRYLDVKWRDFSPRKKDYWVTEYELFSLDTGESIHVEWEVDDELEIYRSDEEVRLKDLSYQGRALKVSDLATIADEEAGDIHYKGSRFSYSDDDSWAARFFEGEQLPGDRMAGMPVRFYEFESASGKNLSVEAWHEDEGERPEREAFTSSRVQADAFRVLQIGAVSD